MTGGRRLASLGLALWIPVWLGCVSPAPPALRLDFFRPVPPEDSWRLKVRAWQAANYLSSLDPGSETPDPTPLADEYLRFSSEFRLEIVQRVLRWVQVYSGLYYRSDNGVDYWPTLDEVIEAGGDDCDGLELLTFALLRSLGFSEGELYRAILFDRLSDAYHMVTLWFRDEERSDPYVLDPSGKISRKVSRLSRISGWEPIVLFDERSVFRVAPQEVARP